MPWGSFSWLRTVYTVYNSYDINNISTSNIYIYVLNVTMRNGECASKHRGLMVKHVAFSVKNWISWGCKNAM